MKHIKKYKLIKETAPIDDLESKFRQTHYYKEAYKEVSRIIEELENNFLLML